MGCSGAELARADIGYLIDRIMHTWSLIRMLPQSRLAADRASLTAVLKAHAGLPEKELLVLGFKHLHAANR
jgi:hypothetical protein